MEYKYEEGQVVRYRGGFGNGQIETVTIIDLGDKNGKPVYDLDNGHWAYEYQLEVI